MEKGSGAAVFAAYPVGNTAAQCHSGDLGQRLPKEIVSSVIARALDNAGWRGRGARERWELGKVRRPGVDAADTQPAQGARLVLGGKCRRRLFYPATRESFAGRCAMIMRAA